MSDQYSTTIRRALPSDAAGIAKVHVDTWRSTYQGIMPDDHLAELSYEKRAHRWSKSLSAPNAPEFVYVAESAIGEIIGFAGAGQERTGKEGYAGELYLIYVMERCQRRGVGRKLASAIAGELLARSMASLLVWALKDNPFRAFYETLNGQMIDEQEVEIAGAKLIEVAYGWQDIRTLAGAPNDRG